jgi:hypothetical protein
MFARRDAPLRQQLKVFLADALSRLERAPRLLVNLFLAPLDAFMC